MNLQNAYELLHRGTIALAQVERNGIRVDEDYCKSAITRINRKINHYTELLLDTPECKEWASKYGPKLSLSSNAQLGDILYNVLKFPVRYYTDTGKPATNEEALKQMEDEFLEYSDSSDFLGLFFKIRKYEKARSTYLEGVLAEVLDGYVHPFFSLHNVKSYRGSAQAPNFQNVPIRNKEIGPIIRKMIIPRAANRHLVEIDFSAIEVRIGACYHKDPTMIAYIKDPSSDMHTHSAEEAFMLSPEQVSKGLRQAGKGLNFSFYYGSWYPDCARKLWETCKRENLKTEQGVPIFEHLESKGITVLGPCNKKDKPIPGTFEYHMMHFEDSLWNRRFKVYNQWRKDVYAQYQKTGYFDSLHGFRYSGHFKRNDVCNWQVQGSGFQCLLWSLCEVQDKLNEYKMQSCIVGQIHDSLIADVPENELNQYVEIASEIMTNKLRKRFEWIIVPIEVEVEVAPVGKSWAEKAKYGKFCSY